MPLGQKDEMLQNTCNMEHNHLSTNPLGLAFLTLADNLLDIVRDADLNLTLPQGTITKDCQKRNNHKQTTIDLVFTTAVLEQQVVRYGVEMKVDQFSDHLSICTEFK